MEGTDHVMSAEGHLLERESEGVRGIDDPALSMALARVRQNSSIETKIVNALRRRSGLQPPHIRLQWLPCELKAD